MPSHHGTAPNCFFHRPLAHDSEKLTYRIEIEGVNAADLSRLRKTTVSLVNSLRELSAGGVGVPDSEQLHDLLGLIAVIDRRLFENAAESIQLLWTNLSEADYHDWSESRSEWRSATPSGDRSGPPSPEAEANKALPAAVDGDAFAEAHRVMGAALSEPSGELRPDSIRYGYVANIAEKLRSLSAHSPTPFDFDAAAEAILDVMFVMPELTPLDGDGMVRLAEKMRANLKRARASVAPKSAVECESEPVEHYRKAVVYHIVSSHYEVGEMELHDVNHAGQRVTVVHSGEHSDVPPHYFAKIHGGWVEVDAGGAPFSASDPTVYASLLRDDPTVYCAVVKLLTEQGLPGGDEA